MQEVSWWTVGCSVLEKSSSLCWQYESDWGTPTFCVYLLGSVVTQVYRFFFWRVKSWKWGGVVVSRQDPQYLPDPKIWCSSAFSSSLCFRVVFTTVFGYLGFLGRAWAYFCLCLSFQALSRHVPLEDFSVLRQKTQISTNNLLSLF